MFTEYDLRGLRKKNEDLPKNEDLLDGSVSLSEKPVSRISRAQKIGKGGYLYDRREWSTGLLFVCHVFIVFFVSMLSARNPNMSIFFLTVSFISMSTWAFTCYGSNRIIINEDGIWLQHGFFFTRKMFYYDEIVKITFGKLDSSYTKNPKSAFEPGKYAGYAGLSGTQCTFFLENGEYYYIFTNYTNEIARALEKITPKLIIERSFGNKEPLF